jgi:hypothetical protein
MMFAAHERFGPFSGDSWTNYVNWSGLIHLTELVSTDNLLCPSVINELVDSDWDYNIHADCCTHFFREWQYLKRRIGYDRQLHNILGLTEEPSSLAVAPDEFEFSGFDILDSYNDISVLTNCGGFPEVFKNSELNQFGLLNEIARANSIANALRELYPDDAHCSECRVWSLCRYVGA